MEAAIEEKEQAVYLGEPGKGIMARITGRIGPGGMAGTYCDCTTCACGACSCNCSCNACGACYCDCACSRIELSWREESFAHLSRVLTALNLNLGDAKRIAEIISIR